MKRHVSTQAPLFGTERVSSRFLHDNDTVAFNYIGLKVILEKHVSLMLLHIPLTIERLKHNDASKYK